MDFGERLGSSRYPAKTGPGSPPVLTSLAISSEPPKSDLWGAELEDLCPPPPQTIDPPTFKRATISAHRSQVRSRCSYIPHTQISQQPPGSAWGQEGPFLAEGGLAREGKPRANHFCLWATVYAHCPAPSPRLPLRPLPSRRESPKLRKCLSLRNHAPGSQATQQPSREGPTRALEQEGKKVSVYENRIKISTI